jgi:hypothetical protein
MIRELALACLVFRNVTNSTSPPVWNMTTTNVTSGDAPTWSIGEIADTALPLLNSTPSFQPSTQPLPEIKNVTVTTFPPTKIIILPLPTNSSNTTASPNITITDLPTKFFDENNTNPYPGYTLPTTPAVLETIMPEIVGTDIPTETSLAVSRIPAVYITLITLILTCLFFFISS